MATGYSVEEKEKEVGGLNIPQIKGVKGYSFAPQKKDKFSSLRGWEFRLATGKLRGEEDEGPWGGFGEQRTLTQEEMANIYAGIRTVGEILPFTRYAFGSGRDEFMKRSTAGKAVELGIETLSLLPIVLLGKGLKVLASGGAKGAKLPFRALKKFPIKGKERVLQEDPFLDLATRDIKKYERIPIVEKAIKKWELTGEEGDKLLKRQPWIWEASKRSGAFFQTKGSKNFQKLFKKDGFLQAKVEKQLAAWSRPHDVQELRHYTVEWNKLVKKIFGKNYKPDSVFRMQAVKMFEEEGKKLKYGDIDTKTMGLFIRDLLEENPAKLYKKMDIGYGHIQPYHTLPVRKVFGFGNAIWGTLDNIYTPVVRMFSNANKYGTLMTSKFHSILASRGLGKLVAGKEAGVVGLKKNFTKRQWEEAGEVVTKMDDAVGGGLKQEEVQAILDSASSVTVRNIAKSWFDFSDSLYSDYVKKKVPQIFRTIGLTGKGRDGLKLLMDDPNGINRYIDVAFSQSFNSSFDTKAKVVAAMLKKARTAVMKNPSWFANKSLQVMTKVEKEELRKRLVEGLAELSPMKKGGKKGFVNYLENYATRIRDKQLVQSRDRFQKLAKRRKAGFTKGRIREVAEEGRVVNLTRIAEARINMQAKELYVYKPLEKVISDAEKLPDKFRNFSEHYIARQLGEASNADVALAQWLTGTVGRFTRRVYDERSVGNLAHTINDLVYMGGLGFKPFSAMRNYFQPLLMVPADMGGVKDLYWLGKGYSSAFKKETRDYIKSIGAIQEFAPDLYLRPRVAGFGGSFTVGGKKFDLPSTQTMRDLALWMFKNSDRHNRYVTGGAAIEKWDYFATKYLSKSLDKKAIKQFSKKVNINSRDEWVRAQLNEHLGSGTMKGVEEAKKLWVYDVIADTQYLYGTLDAPIYGQAAGSLGKMAGIFQSWWMNYGAALEKWALRTPGRVPVVNRRTMTWLLSGAIVEECASKLWAQPTAAKMVHVGPFPTKVNEFMIPPTFAPIYYTARVLAEGIEAIKYQEPERFKRSVKALARSSLMFVPGGLQMAQFARGAEKEGWKGLPKAFIRYDPAREEEY